jgi:hypothetical protein
MSDDSDIRMCDCQNCDWTGTVSQLGRQIKQIPNFFERVSEGELCPVGECPNCSALAHLIEIPEQTIRIVLAYVAEHWNQQSKKETD